MDDDVVARVRAPEGALIFGRLASSARDVAPPCVDVALRLGDPSGGEDPLSVLPPAATTRACRADPTLELPLDALAGSPGSQRARWWRSRVGAAADPPSVDDPPGSGSSPPDDARDFVVHLANASPGDSGVVTVSLPSASPTARACVLAVAAIDIAGAAQEFALRLPSPAAACAPSPAAFPPTVVDRPAERPSLAWLLLAAALAPKLLGRALRPSRSRGRRRSSPRDPRRPTSHPEAHHRDPYAPPSPPSSAPRDDPADDDPGRGLVGRAPPARSPPPRGRFPGLAASWRARDPPEGEGGRAHDPAEALEWVITAEVARGDGTRFAGTTGDDARGRDLVAAFLASPPRRPPGWRGFPDAAPSLPWDEEDEENEGEMVVSGGTAADEETAGRYETGDEETSGDGRGEARPRARAADADAAAAADDAAALEALLCDEASVDGAFPRPPSAAPPPRVPPHTRSGRSRERPRGGGGSSSPLRVRMRGVGTLAEARRTLGDLADSTFFARARLSFRGFPRSRASGDGDGAGTDDDAAEERTAGLGADDDSAWTSSFEAESAADDDFASERAASAPAAAPPTAPSARAADDAVALRTADDAAGAGAGATPECRAAAPPAAGASLGSALFRFINRGGSPTPGPPSIEPRAEPRAEPSWRRPRRGGRLEKKEEEEKDERAPP